jgi:8-oxo-dGTP pyrophosphatase MutT (NUDIX family)
VPHSNAQLAGELRPVLLSPEDAAALDVRGRIDAAVLVPLYVSDHELHAVFTRRRADLRRHAGEISFPGGRQDVEEEDLRTTALREAEEEIGLPPDAVELVGALVPTPTIVTNYAIYPFVGIIEPGHVWTPSAAEVDEVLELPLRAVRDGHDRRRLMRRGVPFRTDVYEVDGQVIWGATARIVGDLLERIEPLLSDAAPGAQAGS